MISFVKLFGKAVLGHDSSEADAVVFFLEIDEKWVSDIESIFESVVV